jgi:hypothetical protein
MDMKTSSPNEPTTRTKLQLFFGMFASLTGVGMVVVGILVVVMLANTPHNSTSCSRQWRLPVQYSPTYASSITQTIRVRRKSAGTNASGV